MNQANFLFGYKVITKIIVLVTCLLYTFDAADEEDSVDPGGRRIIKKKQKKIKQQQLILAQIYTQHFQPIMDRIYFHDLIASILSY